MEPIYLDHAATTPLDPSVLEAMLPYLGGTFGNASSAHQFGREASVAVEASREKIAELIGAEPSEIVFTSGGTESDNAVIRGVFDAARRRGRNRIITSPIEHHAVLHTVECTKLHQGVPTYLSPQKDGSHSLEELDRLIDDATALVSLMHVNNEIGSLLPLEEVAALCRGRGVPFHSDAVQSIGKVPLNAHASGVDFLSMSAHKIYGPKGIGFMYIRRNSPWMPWMHGGSQERRRRGGTLNVAGIVGLAAALESASSNMEQSRAHHTALRGRLLEKLDQAIPGRYQINGGDPQAVPHIINLSFRSPEGEGVDGEMLLLNLDVENICVSNGSACTSGAMEPSHVLLGIGLDPDIAHSSIRISFGRSNTLEQVDHIVNRLAAVLDRMMGNRRSVRTDHQPPSPNTIP